MGQTESSSSSFVCNKYSCKHIKQTEEPRTWLCIVWQHSMARAITFIGFLDVLVHAYNIHGDPDVCLKMYEGDTSIGRNVISYFVSFCAIISACLQTLHSSNRDFVWGFIVVWYFFFSCVFSTRTNIFIVCRSHTLHVAKLNQTKYTHGEIEREWKSRAMCTNQTKIIWVFPRYCVV